jgi:hypothetical protein
MSETNPVHTLLQITGGYALSRCLHVVADLGVADALGDTPRTAAELAAAVGVDPAALGRILRLLAAHDVFAIQGDTICHTEASQILRSNHPHSLRAFIRVFGGAVNWSIYEALDHAVRTGRPATEKVLPGGLWAYRREHPDEGSMFNAAMTARARRYVAGVRAAYDFSGFDLVGDIGGGLGHLLLAVLDSAPTVKGVLFDLPPVISEASGLASERLQLQAGDFFTDPLPVCDAYLAMQVIHDWGDEDAVAILRAIRRVAPTHAKLLIIEHLIPDDPGPHWSKILDIHMLTLLGGRERTRQEYAALLAQAGFAFAREIATGSDVVILEAVLV